MHKPLAILTSLGILAASHAEIVPQNTHLEFIASQDLPGDAVWVENRGSGNDLSFAGNTDHTPLDQAPFLGISAAYQGVAKRGSYNFDDRGRQTATFEFWINVESLAAGTEQVIFEAGGTGRGICFYLSNDILTFNVDGQGSDHYLSTPLTDTGLHHVVGTIKIVGTDGSLADDAMSLYVDNLHVGTNSGIQIHDWAGGDPFGLGGPANSSSGAETSAKPFEGSIGLFRYYRYYQFSAGDVDLHYRDAQLPLVTSKLKFEYIAALDPDGDSSWTDQRGGNAYALDEPESDKTLDIAPFKGITAAYHAAGTSPYNYDEDGKLPATFEFWIAVNDLAAGLDQVIFETGGAGRGISFTLDDDTLVFNVDGQGSDYFLTAPLSLGLHHIVGVVTERNNKQDAFDDSIDLYVDNVPVQQVNNARIHDWAGANLSGLGRMNSSITGTASGTTGQDFHGDIAVFRYYRGKAFRASEVDQNYRYAQKPLVDFEPIAFAGKGFGGWVTANPNQAADMGLNWYYNWGNSVDESKLPETIEYIPMLWGASGLEETKAKLDRLVGEGYDTVLAYNEPDSKVQSNVTVERALERWPLFLQSGLRIGSPAPTDNAEGRQWLAEFMAGLDPDEKPDFMCAHWYRDAGANGFFSAMQTLYDTYGLPIWVTEFARVNWNSSGVAVTPEQQAAFLRDVLARIDDYPFIERIALFTRSAPDDVLSSSRYLDVNGDLNGVGRAYQGLSPRNSFPFNFAQDGDSLGWGVRNGTLAGVDRGVLTAQANGASLSLVNELGYIRTEAVKGIVLNVRVDQPATLSLFTKGSEQADYPATPEVEFDFDTPGRYQTFFVATESFANWPEIVKGLRIDVQGANDPTVELDFIRSSFGDYDVNGIADADETGTEDMDGDGIPDWLDDDMDGDGASNHSENELGKIVRGGGFNLEFKTYENETFDLDGSIEVSLDNSLHGRTTAAPTWLELHANGRHLNLDGTLYDQLFVRMALTDGVDSGDTFLFRWTHDESDDVFELSIPIGSGSAIRTYTVDLSENEDWSGKRISSISLSPAQAPDRAYEVDFVLIQEKDSDGDGYSDRVELELGRDPLDGYVFAEFETEEFDQWLNQGSRDFAFENGMARGRGGKGTGFTLNGSGAGFKLQGDDVKGFYIQHRIFSDPNERSDLRFQNSLSDRWYRVRTQRITNDDTYLHYLNLSSNPNWVGQTITGLRVEPSIDNRRNWEIDWIRSLYAGSDRDTDGDSISDYEEGGRNSDNDELPDFMDPDSDNDSVEDGVENAFASDGTDPNSIPEYLLEVESANDYILGFAFPEALDSRFTYRIETTTDLSSGAWTPLNEKPAGQDWTDSGSIAEETIDGQTRVVFVPDLEASEGDGSRFFRVVATYQALTVSLPVTGSYSIDLDKSKTLIVPSLVHPAAHIGYYDELAAATDPEAAILTQDSALWNAGQFDMVDGMPRYYVEFLEGPSAGVLADILANTLHSLVIDEPFDAFPDTDAKAYRIRKHLTLAEALGAHSGLKAGSKISLYDLDGERRFADFKAGSWMDRASKYNVDDRIIRPGEGLMLWTDSESELLFGTSGAATVKTGPTRIALFGSTPNLVGPVNPNRSGDPSLLGAIGLQAALADLSDIVIAPSRNFEALGSLHSSGANDPAQHAFILDIDTFVDAEGNDANDAPIEAGEGIVILTEDGFKHWIQPDPLAP